MTALVKLPVFDSSYANCEACELLPQLERNQTAFAYRPQKFNGIMIVGEGPGAQEVACLVPETLVLMADLTWQQLGNVEIGDRILTLEEEPVFSGRGASGYNPRRWVIATVTNKIRHRKETVRVTSEHGVLQGSGDHLALTMKGAMYRWRRLDHAVAGKKRATHFVSVGQPWRTETSRNAGWLAGFFDGEGHIGGSKGGSATKVYAGFSQNAGPTCDRAIAYLTEFGFALRAREESRSKGVVCVRANLRGGVLAAMRFLGSIRPERLIVDFQKTVLRVHNRGCTPSRVLSREATGVREVIDITTTAGTFIANGLVVHNCGRPFVGISGKLLDTLLADVGIDVDECWITNATCCRPPPKDKALQQAFPNAIPSCLGRLEAEIAAVRPKIILALGAAAWIAVSGYDVKKTKTIPFDCERCDPATRKIGPVIQCAGAVPNPADNGSTSVPCGWYHHFASTAQGPAALALVDAAELAELKQSDCPNCGAALKRLRPKMMKCPDCGGRKRRNEEHWEFDWDYNITSAAGGIFEPAGAGSTRLDYELSAWLGENGVAYVVPTYHPAHILRGQQFLAKTVQKHLQKVKRLLNGATPQEVRYSHTCDPAVVREFVFGWITRGEAPPHFSVDIETEAIDEDDVAKDARKIRNVTKIKCIGLSTLDDTLVVDTRAANPVDANDPLLAVLYDFLTDVRIAKSAHHGFGYDWIVIDLLWNIPWHEMVESVVDDTMHAHINLYPDEPHKLDHVTFEVADVHAWKPAKRVKNALVHTSFEELALYNARDAWHTRLAIDHFGVDRGRAIPGGRMDRAGLSRVYEVDSKLRKIALGMTMTGVPLNYKAFRQVGDESRRLIADADRSTRDALLEMGYPQEATQALNFNSTPQLIELMFGSRSFLQLTPIDFTDKHQPATSKVALQKLLATVEDPQKLKTLNGLITLRKQQYIAKNFVFAEDMQPWADGRIHTIWQPWGTRTGRFSSSPNMQNIPVWLRKAFEAPRGRAIVGADGDQLELRGIAWLSGDKELIRRALGADDKRKLEPDYDPHSYVASLAFSQYVGLALADSTHKKPEAGAKITKCFCETCRRKALREIVKRVIYGLNYGAGAATVLEAIYNGGYEGPPITIAMIEHVKKTVFTVFAGIPVWRDKQVALARERGALFSPLHGRRRIFPLAGFPGVDIPVTEIYNFPIQTVGADIMNEALIAFAEALPDVDPTAMIIAQIHDAIYAECDERKGEEVKKLLVACMSSERTLNGVTMRFSASGKVGRTLVS